MLLSELAEIIQGNIPTRIEVRDGIRVELLTMQDLNYFANLSNEETTTKYIIVQSDRIKSLSFVKEGDVVVSLSSCKAIVIDIKQTEVNVDEFLSKIKHYVEAPELTREMCYELIDKIVVGGHPKVTGTERIIGIVYKVDINSIR